MVDADSSQTLAILEVNNGRNLVNWVFSSVVVSDEEKEPYQDVVDAVLVRAVDLLQALKIYGPVK